MWASGKGADNVIAVFMRHNVDIQQVDKNGGSGMSRVVQHLCGLLGRGLITL